MLGRRCARPLTRATSQAILLQARFIRKATTPEEKDTLLAKQRWKRGLKKRWTAMSQRALCHGQDRKRWDHVSWAGNVKIKYKNPNIRMAKFWSDILERYVEIPTTTRLLKRIDRQFYFSIDRYILETSPIRMTSKLGEALRVEI